MNRLTLPGSQDLRAVVESGSWDSIVYWYRDHPVEEWSLMLVHHEPMTLAGEEVSVECTKLIQGEARKEDTLVIGVPHLCFKDWKPAGPWS